MKWSFFIVYLLMWNFSHGQKLSGTWQGIINTVDVKNELSVNGSWIYLDMSIVKGMIDGKIRHETLDQFYIYEVVGRTLENGHLEITETKLGIKSKLIVPQEKQQFDFYYDAKKGYLIGETKDKKSTLTLYKAAINILEKTPNILSSHQLEKFQQELADGLSSPEKRLEELRSFKFEPIYFDYDKDQIQAQYEAYLIEMIRMVKSHSD
ncbi:MAG: hypothetical protein ACKOXP_08125, partial [Flavobacteriales bacterium]